MAEIAAVVDEPTVDPAFVSTAQVSQALGVSVSTVKRWVDDGILPAQKTAGGHRRLHLSDVLRLVRKGDFPFLDLSVFGPCVQITGRDATEAIVDQLESALNAGDRSRIRDLLFGAFRAGRGIAVIADQIVAPAMHRVGTAWQKGRTDILHEHRGTQMCVEALFEMRSTLESNSQKDRPLALGGAVEGDHSALPSLLAQMVLLEAGWKAVNLGPHTPMESLRMGMAKFRPKLIWISASHLLDVDRFVSEYQRLQKDAEKQGIAIAIGGRAIDESVRSRITYATFGEGLSHLAYFANTLCPAPTPPKRGRPRRTH